MESHFEPGITQYFAAFLVIVVILGIVGFKRGRGGQLVISLTIISLQALVRLEADMLISFVNLIYRSVLLVASCGMAEDSGPCVQASHMMRWTIVNPDDPGQTRLFLLATFTFALLLTLLLVIRLGNPPRSAVHRVLGAALGVANGFILSYLLLPLALQREQTPLPVGETVAGQAFAPGVELGPGFNAVFQTSRPFILLMVIVLFVILAVRFVQPPKVES